MVLVFSLCHETFLLLLFIKELTARTAESTNYFPIVLCPLATKINSCVVNPCSQCISYDTGFCTRWVCAAKLNTL